MKSAKGYVFPVLICFYVFWAFTFEVVNQFSNYFDGLFLVSADHLPNQLYSFVKQHFYVMPLIMLAYMVKHWGTIRLYPNKSIKEISNKESQVGASLLLMLFAFLGLIFIFKSEQHLLLALFSPMMLILAKYHVLHKAIAIIAKAKFIKKESNASASFNTLGIARLFLVLLSFFLVLSGAFHLGNNTTKLISLIGDKSLMMTPTSCADRKLKPATCEDAVQTAVDNGNLFMLSYAYQTHPPSSVTQIYAQITDTLDNAYRIYGEPQWADSEAQANTYQVLKSLYLDNREEHEMTLLQYRKAIESGRDNEFAHNLIANKRGGLLLEVFKSLYLDIKQQNH